MSDIFVARQPIFDRDGELEGYELLYRQNGDDNFAVGGSSNRMATDTVVHSFLEIGIEQVTEGKLAYINVTRELLVDRLVELLDPYTVVVELLEDVPCDAETVAACRELKAAGYVIALDDFVYAPEYEPFLEIAGIVKVEVLGRTRAELEPLVAQLRRHGARLLAEKIETAEAYEMCRLLGFDLFQGYYFQHPQILTGKAMPAETVAIVKLMNLLKNAHASEVRIEEAFRSDPKLSYKLLRIVNSASVGGRGVQSIQFAIRLLGRDALYRWMAVLLVHSMAAGGGADRELAKSALVRARLCELLAEASTHDVDAGAMFIVGLFSKLDALLRMPMTEVLASVDLAPEVKAALLDRAGPFAPALSLAEAYELGQFTEIPFAATRAGVRPSEVLPLSTAAIVWAAERMEGFGM